MSLGLPKPTSRQYKVVNTSCQMTDPYSLSFATETQRHNKRSHPANASVRCKRLHFPIVNRVFRRKNKRCTNNECNRHGAETIMVKGVLVRDFRPPLVAIDGALDILRVQCRLSSSLCCSRCRQRNFQQDNVELHSAHAFWNTFGANRCVKLVTPH